VQLRCWVRNIRRLLCGGKWPARIMRTHQIANSHATEDKSMKVMKLEVTVIDFDGLGADEVRKAIESTRYANDCISPNVLSVEVRDIGEWSDDHPLNNSKTADDELRRLFGA